MNNFEKALEDNYFTQAQFNNIRKLRIGIAGNGGLGSNIAVCLVRSGFQNLELLDFDIVDYSNLNRQFYFANDVGKDKVDCLKTSLLSINSNLNITLHKKRLTQENSEEFFQKSDIIFEAFDNVPSKKLIFEAYGNSEKIIISGSGMGGFSNDREIKIRKIGKRHFLVGDFISSVSSPDIFPLSPRVTVCAALMASIALEHACKLSRDLGL